MEELKEAWILIRGWGWIPKGRKLERFEVRCNPTLDLNVPLHFTITLSLHFDATAQMGVKPRVVLSN